MEKKTESEKEFIRQDRGKSTLSAQSQQLTGYLDEIMISLKIVAVSVQESMLRGDELEKIQSVVVNRASVKFITSAGG